MPVDPRRVKELFGAALDQADPSARKTLLDRECAGDSELRRRLDNLLSAHDKPISALDKLLAGPDAIQTTDNPGSIDNVGSIIGGRYKLLQEIGEGGMGSVFMADQLEPIKRRVAVKVIKAGMDSARVLARFEAERQALALMDHPNIARVLDAGTTNSGRPFFVMELVKGVPLTQYCDQHKLPVLDRLNLFVQICSAVQHAHQKGIIHRDLKPGNILVESHDGKPLPKVIDFGLAKATSGIQLSEHTLFTALGTVAGTPLYMAPEQAAFNAVDVDTRADVYALGVILYELLTGTTPIERETLKKAAFDEMLRMIREQDSVTPSNRLSNSESKASVAAMRQMEPAKLGRFVKGELDWIVMKSLAKERDRRYESATAFARDIERFLNHEAVHAGPPSVRYKFRKFVRRNRGAVLAAIGVVGVLAALVVVLAVGIVQREAANRDIRAALTREAEARKRTREALDTLTSDALQGWFTREENLSPEQKNVLQRLLDHYAAFAEEAGDTPDARRGQARALLRVGNIQVALGDRTAAGQSLRRATVLAGTASAPITDDGEGWELVADAHEHLFRFYHNGRHYREAEACAREALAARARLVAAEPTNHHRQFALALEHSNLAAALGEQKRMTESDAEHQSTVVELERLVREHPEEAHYAGTLATELNNRAIHARNRQKVADALVDNGRALDLLRRLLAAHPGHGARMEQMAGTLGVRAELLQATQPAEAEAAIREAIGIAVELSDSFPAIPRYRVRLADLYVDLSGILSTQGRHPAAAVEAKRAVAAARSVTAQFADDLPPGRALSKALTQLSEIYRAMVSGAEAEAAARASLAETDRLSRLFGKRPDLAGDRANALRKLGGALLTQARFTDKEAVDREVIAALAELARDNPELQRWTDLIIARIDLAETLVSRGATADAEVQLQAVAGDLDRLPVAERETFQAIYYFEMAKLTVRSGRWREANDWAGRAIEAFARRHQEHPGIAQNRDYLVQCRWHRATAREKLARPADAATDWRVAAEEANILMDKAFYRAHCGSALRQAKDLSAADTEFAAAIQQAEATLKGEGVVGITLYDAAAVYALAAGGITNREMADKYAAEAVRLLGRAAAVGFLNDRAQIAALQKADEYSALHARSDYKNLLAELGTRFPPIPQRAPPPRVVGP
jgi:eukaryotic-like serine/threonine-protein kinase